MKRRVILILIVVGVLGAVGAGIWWYVHRNTGWRVLNRAELALRAKNFDRAIELAKDFAAANPNDYRGPYMHAKALIGLGRYEEARTLLDQAKGLAPDKSEIPMAMADTYAHPARQAMALDQGNLRVAGMQAAIEQIGQARDVLSKVTTSDPTAALDIKAALGLIEVELGYANRTLGERLKKEADIARSAGAADQAATKAKAAEEATAEAVRHLDLAKTTLSEVVARDAELGKGSTPHERAANTLVRLCLQDKDSKTLAAARKAIMALEDPPPLAAMMLILDEAGAGEAEDETPANRKKLEAAAAKLDEILKRHPDHPDAIQVKLSRADLAIRLGDVAKAEEICNAILETDARQAQARLLRASALMSRGNLAGAEQELFALKTDFPQWPQAHYAYAQAAMKTGKKELAKEALRTVTKLDPTHAGALMYLAGDLLRGGFYDQAFAEAKAFHTAHPDNPMAVRLFAEAAARTDQTTVALEALKAAEKDFPNSAAMQLAVAEGYALLGNAEGARKAATAAAEVKPTTLGEHMAVAQAMLRMGRTAEAEGVLDKAAAAYPQSPAVRFQMGELYAQTSRVMQAIDQYQSAIQLAPQNAAYRLAHARALQRAGLLEECEAATRELLGIDPSSAEATLLMAQMRILRGEQPGTSQEGAAGKQRGLPLALAYLNHREPEKCIEACQAVLKEKADDPDARWLLGHAYLAKGGTKDIEQCIEQWTAVLKASPDRLLVYRELGQILSRDKQPKEVEAVLAAIPGAKTEMVDSAMAWLFQQKRLYVEAAEVYARLTARTSAPEDVRSAARLDRARCLAMAGRTDQAITELDLLAGQKAWRGRALLAKVAVLGTVGRTNETEPILQELQKSAAQSGNATFLGRIGMFYLQTGQAEKALKVAEELQGLRPQDPQPCLLRAAALSGLGQGEEAIKSYRDAVARQPGDLSNHVVLVRALDVQGDLKAALDALTQLETCGETGQMLAFAERANLFSRWGLHTQAIADLEKLAERDAATSPQVRLGLGQAFARLGQTDKAREEFQKVPEYASQYFTAQQSLVELAKTDDDRLAILDKLKLKADTRVQAMLVAQRMDILLRADRAPEAIKEFQAFVPTLPPNSPPPEPMALVALQAMLRAGDLAKAAAISVQMAAQTGSPAWKRTAALLTMDGQPDKARSVLPDVAEADPHSAFVGLCLAAQSGAATKAWTDRLAKIEQQFAEAKPPQSLPRTHKVLAALAAGNVADAEKQLADVTGEDLLGTAVIGELVSSAKARPEARAEAVKLLKASVAADLGLSDLARRWALDLVQARPTCQWAAALAASRSPDVANLRKVLAVLKPDDCILARMIQAAILKEEAQYEKAAEIYRLAAAAEKNNPQLTMNQAIATEGAGQLQEALALYRKVWETAKNPTAANNAAYITSELYAKDKDKLTEAAKWAEDAVKTAPTVAAFRDTKGWLAHLLGSDPEARAELLRAVRALPDSPEVHYHLGMVEAKAGNNNFARWHFEATVSLGEGMKSRGQTVPKAVAEAVRLAREALPKLDGA